MRERQSNRDREIEGQTMRVYGHLGILVHAGNTEAHSAGLANCKGFSEPMIFEPMRLNDSGSCILDFRPKTPFRRVHDTTGSLMVFIE